MESPEPAVGGETVAVRKHHDGTDVVCRRGQSVAGRSEPLNRRDIHGALRRPGRVDEVQQCGVLLGQRPRAVGIESGHDRRPVHLARRLPRSGRTRRRPRGSDTAPDAAVAAAVGRGGRDRGDGGWIDAAGARPPQPHPDRARTQRQHGEDADHGVPDPRLPGRRGGPDRRPSVPRPAVRLPRPARPAACRPTPFASRPTPFACRPTPFARDRHPAVATVAPSSPPAPAGASACVRGRGTQRRGLRPDLGGRQPGLPVGGPLGKVNGRRLSHPRRSTANAAAEPRRPGSGSSRRRTIASRSSGAMTNSGSGHCPRVDWIRASVTVSAGQAGRPDRQCSATDPREKRSLR